MTLENTIQDNKIYFVKFHDEKTKEIYHLQLDKKKLLPYTLDKELANSYKEKLDLMGYDAWIESHYLN